MSILDTEPIQSVSEVTRSIKHILENTFRFIRVRGEISNFKMPYSGHSYFTLKDGAAQIRAVLFKQQRRFIDLSLKDGQEVVCFGRVTVYEPRGEYQLIVDSVELFGTGILQKEFEKLKQKMLQKGYFAEEIKKPLPVYPNKIVVISSPTGAAIQDFLKIVKTRKSPVQIQILPVRVQGKDAAGEIVNALEIANSIGDVDIIVLCRGGGSLEDLWAFNEEIVGEAIHRSIVPVVTGIGHEIDFTIADFCADFRCPTPTAAAEKIVPDTDTLRQLLSFLENGIIQKLQRKMSFLEQRLHHSVRMLGTMKTLYKDSELRLQLSKLYLVQAAIKSLAARENQLAEFIRRLQAQAPSNRIELQQRKLQFLSIQLRRNMQQILERKNLVLGKHATLLNSVSPLATLGRGYSIVRKYDAGDASYQILTRSAQGQSGDELNILFHEGELDCIVK